MLWPLAGNREGTCPPGSVSQDSFHLFFVFKLLNKEKGDGKIILRETLCQPGEEENEEEIRDA